MRAIVFAATAAADSNQAKTALQIAWVGAGGTVVAALLAALVAIVQALLKRSSDPTANFIDQLQEQITWEHEERLRVEKRLSDTQEQLSTQQRMNDALIRRLNPEDRP